MIGYVLVDGGHGHDLRDTVFKHNGQIMVFTSEKAANKFRYGLSDCCNVETKDLCAQKVSIKPIYPKDE